MTESGVEFEADNRSNGTLAKFSNLRTNSFSSNNHADNSSHQHNAKTDSKYLQGSSRSLPKQLVESDSETESEGSTEDIETALRPSHYSSNREIEQSSNAQLLNSHFPDQSTASHAVLNQPTPNRKSFGARHKSTYLQTGVHGKQESASLLVDIPINDELSETDDDIPLSWQRSSRSMREQLIKDGYNLDLESDNEDLDLIPPKQNFGVGGICSCSNNSCVIS